METTSSGDVPFVPKSVPLSRSRCQIWCQDGQDNIKSNTEKSAVSCYGALFSCVDNEKISACMSHKDLIYV